MTPAATSSETPLARHRPSRFTPTRLVVAALTAGALAWLANLGYQSWRFDVELERAAREADAGRYSPARDRLARLSTRWPGRDEVEYKLGGCEAMLGHVDAALAAWSRVPEGSTLLDRATLDRARVALEHGRLTAASESLARLADRRGEVGREASRLADQLDLYLGRDQAITARVERRWAVTDNQAALLRTHWMLQTQPFPIEAAREALDRRARESPDEPLIWLGQADLALRTGQQDTADAWLQRCESRLPDNPDVAVSRLHWALAANRLDSAMQAASRLPAERFTAAEVADLDARVAHLRGDSEAERRALEQRVGLEPGDVTAWTRLADLAAHQGRAEAMALARKRKAELDRLSSEYRTLMGSVAVGDTSKYADLARTAESLGRRFEARGWYSLLARQSGKEREARDGQNRLARLAPASPLPRGQTLADLLKGAVLSGVVPSSTPEPSVPEFRDIAEAAGLQFVYDNDRTPACRLPETMGGGVGLIDYDGDGLLDVYAVQGGHFPTGTPGPTGGDHLFRNRGDGTFVDVSTASGIAAMPRGYGHGVSVGDYDNDGRPDLFVTRWRSYALYRNRGDGTFDDVTDRVGLGGDRGWPTSSAFADLDNDGDLDLYVCHYLSWDPERSPRCPDADTPGLYRYCMPRSFPAEPDQIFRNDGGRFVDLTADAGIVDKDGRGLGVVAADLDGDGRVDLYVANDMSANFLFRNLGGFRFAEVGEASGAAANGEGGYQAGMGIACGDIDGDDRPDLAVTNFYGESTTLFRNLGGGLFADQTAASGLAAPSRFVLGFGASFLDANNDGWLDLATANGHVNDYRPAIPYAMPAQLYLGLGRGEGRFVEVSERAGACWKVPRVARGLAVGDLDNDGRPDLILLSQGGALACFRNLGTPERAGDSLTIRLEGTRSNRDGFGAVVRVSVGGRTQSAQRIGGGSFLSSSDGRIHFGLGTGKAPISVEVLWPSGRREHHDGLAPGGYRIVEGELKLKPLNGWPVAR